MDLDDISNNKRTPLRAILNRGGGRYKASDQSNASDLFIFTDVQFESIRSTDAHSIVIEVSFKSVKGLAKYTTVGRRLARGSFVGLLAKAGADSDEPHIFLGMVADDPAARTGRSSVQINFFDDSVYTEAVKVLAAKRLKKNRLDDGMLFFEVPGQLSLHF
jgi:hypothetical protein